MSSVYVSLFAIPSFLSLSLRVQPSLMLCQYDPLVQPALLRHDIKSSPKAQTTIASARFNAARVLAGHDDRVLVIVGPCSIHSTEQAMEYARLLKEKMSTWPNLLIVMRAYLCVRSQRCFPCI